MLHRSDPLDEFIKSYPTMVFPQAASLPKPCRFSSGMTGVLRNMNKDEDEKLYKTLLENVQDGVGYALYEFPSLDYFRKDWLSQGHCIVCEQDETGEIIFFSLIKETTFERGQHTTCQNDIVICKEFRNQGIAAEVFILMKAIAKELGYTGSMENFFISNVRVGVGLRRLGFNMCGVLPNAGYVGEAGWEDAVLMGFKE